MENLMEIRNLSKRLGNFRLNEISLSLPAGYVMGFVGPNGAGKSTTIKLILNLLHKDAGTVKLFGLDNIKHEIEVKQKIGFVLDDTYLHDGMTVKQVGKLVSGFYENWDAAKFDGYLTKFGLYHDEKVKELSSGMKTKLLLSVALSHHAKLLILDEPTSGLDPVVRDDVLSELFQFVQDGTCSVFFSTHITSDLDKVADYVTFLKDGAVLLSLTKDEIDERYGVVKCGKKQLESIKPFILRYRESEFGVEALTASVPDVRGLPGLVIEKATIEDIMLLFEKGVNP